jgi:hypothetical protein
VGTVENGRRWCSGGGGGVGGGGCGWILDLGRRGTEVRYRGCCTAEGKMGGRGGGKCDLKAGHKRPETEYVRTYRSTFDRTRAGAWVCVWMIRSNLQE